MSDAPANGGTDTYMCVACKQVFVGIAEASRHAKQFKSQKPIHFVRRTSVTEVKP